MKIFQKQPFPKIDDAGWIKIIGSGDKKRIENIYERNIKVVLKDQAIKYDFKEPLICASLIKSYYMILLRSLNDWGFIKSNHPDLEPQVIIPEEKYKTTYFQASCETPKIKTPSMRLPYEKEEKQKFNKNDFKAYFDFEEQKCVLNEDNKQVLYNTGIENFKTSLLDGNILVLNQLLDKNEFKAFIVFCISEIVTDYYTKDQQLPMDCFSKFTFYAAASMIEKYMDYLDNLSDEEKDEIIFQQDIKNKKMVKLENFFATFPHIQTSDIVKSISLLIIVG